MKLEAIQPSNLSFGVWCGMMQRDMDEKSLKLNLSKFIFGLFFFLPNCMINSLHVKLLGFEFQGNDNWTLFIQQILAKSLLSPKTCKDQHTKSAHQIIHHLLYEQKNNEFLVHLAIVEKSCQPSMGIRGTILGRLWRLHQLSWSVMACHPTY